MIKETLQIKYRVQNKIDIEIFKDFQIEVIFCLLV